jgi:hypothetical protein
LPRHIARWDLDKTYLRTDFDTIRDVVRTAFERPGEKRTNPGASTLLREMVRAGVSVHILSGSPEQMRRRLEDKLRLDGIQWDSFTLKPNLQNLLRLRFRAVKDQLGFKLPALLHARLNATPPSPGDPGIRHETLFGDDAEADAFVYSLYADTLAGLVDEDLLVAICDRGRVYPDVVESIVDCARQVERVEAIERILIHLERQTPPDDFRVYGSRTVPFYNYLQAAFVVHEDGRIPGETVLRVGVDLVVHHRFDGDALARSYLDLVRRGHLQGIGTDDIAQAFEAWTQQGKVPGYRELKTLVERLPALATLAKGQSRATDFRVPDYVTLVAGHNARRSRLSR